MWARGTNLKPPNDRATRRTSSLSRNPCIGWRGTRMLWIQFGNVKEGRMKDFQEWTKKNEGQFEKHAPPGWAYRGTFGAVLGFGNYDSALIMECSKYGDFDKLREHKDEIWDRLGRKRANFSSRGRARRSCCANSATSRSWSR